jgi:leucyl-tRNA synthetase
LRKSGKETWADTKPFAAELDTSKPKYFIMDMFPYPSGAGLHVGHCENYTASDILARYKRACGFNVLYPIGWDAFGLPTEQYALKTGIHPREATAKNIEVFSAQMREIGLSYDFSRQVTTSTPSITNGRNGFSSSFSKRAWPMWSAARSGGARR